MIRTLALLAAAVPLMVAAAPVPRLTPEGWGKVRIGMTRAALIRTGGADSQPRSTGGPAPTRCDQFHPRRTPPGMIATLLNGRLSALTVTKRNLASARGIRVGDPVARVRTAYRGTRLADEPHAYSKPPARYLTAWAATGAARRGIRYEIDGKGRVSAISAGGEAITYVEGCV